MARSVKSLPHNLEDPSLIPSTYVKSGSQRAGEWLETAGLGVGYQGRSCQAGKAHRDFFPTGVMALLWEEFGENSERSWVRREVRLCLGDAGLMRRKGGLIRWSQDRAWESALLWDTQARDGTGPCRLAGSTAEFPESPTVIRKGNQPWLRL